jgi:tRNA dimethylallyltransferase
MNGDKDRKAKGGESSSYVHLPPNAAVLAIVGATGTGKSALADALAVRFGGEVVNADSMQVYRGMNIGTAKVPPSERRVPYHCIDLVDPDVPFTAALYQRTARAAIDDMLARDVTPVLCGGTGLYVRSALDDFRFDEERENGTLRTVPTVSTAPEPSPFSSLRERLTAQAEELGAEVFHELLTERDPQSAALIHPHNVRRVIRAFEFLEQGTSYAKQHEGFAEFSSVYPVRFIGLSVEPEVLYKVIERRVDSMIAAGLLEELQGLLDAGFREAVCARQAIGYKEFVPVLEGSCSLEEATAQVKQATRRYAKRQRTWFRRDSRIEWLDATNLHRLVLAGDLTPASFTQQLVALTLHTQSKITR